MLDRGQGQGVMGRGHPVTPVMSALQGPRPISLQSRIDQQNLPFSNEVDNIISATQTFNADNWLLSGWKSGGGGRTMMCFRAFYVF